MINIIVGKKGSGKTKYLVNHVNMAVKDEPGTLVFLSNGSRLIYDLKHSVRYVDTTDYKIRNYDVFYGFLTGIFSNNYDISHIFIDSMWKIVESGADGIEGFLTELEKFSNHFNVNFTIAISEDKDNIPESVGKYIVEL